MKLLNTYFWEKETMQFLCYFKYNGSTRSSKDVLMSMSGLFAKQIDKLSAHLTVLTGHAMIRIQSNFLQFYTPLPSHWSSRHIC